MQTKRLGRSAIYVSKICMGTMTFGGQADEKMAHRVLDQSLDAGIKILKGADRAVVGAGGDPGGGGGHRCAGVPGAHARVRRGGARRDDCGLPCAAPRRDDRGAYGGSVRGATVKP